VKAVTGLPKLLSELGQHVAGGDAGERRRVLARVTDLLMSQADQFNDSHIAIFDHVILLLAEEIEVRARAVLAERLADIRNAPPNTVRTLALDEIVVARPLLARSQRLTDQDLIAAAAKGRDHMLAISERRGLNEPVTEVLVRDGDRLVSQAVAANPTAHFSDRAFDLLLERSKADALLHATLSRRVDIPPRHLAMLFDLAKDAARQRIQADTGADIDSVDRAVEQGAEAVQRDSDQRLALFEEALRDVQALAQADQLGERELAAFALAGKRDHAIAALAFVARVPMALAETAMRAPTADAAIVIARAAGFGEETLRALIRVSLKQRATAALVQRAIEAFLRMSPATAGRMLQFMIARQRVPIDATRRPHGP
jgi:uncharacterized protein (DUF2336 family)